MNENHRNVEESEYNDTTSLWFNNRLFSLNGVPLKFYLEGYGPIEFHEAVQIIEAYGGELSPPDAPDTFVFCQSDHPVDEGKYDRYDIQYFQDSIIAIHPQNLTEYKLRKSQNEESPSSEDETRPPRSQTEEENPDKPPELIKYTLHEIPDRQSVSSKEPNDDSTNSHHYGIHHTHENNSEDDDDDISSSSSDAGKGIELHAKRILRKKAEARVDFDRLVESQIPGPSSNPEVDNETTDDDQGNPEISCHSSSENEGDSDNSVVSHVPDDSRPPPGLPVSTKMMEQKKEKRVITRTRHNFTENDNEIIIRWLMEKNIRPSKTGLGIWKRFVKEKVLLRCDITCWNLQGHFRKTLSKHPTFVKWINDTQPSGRVFNSRGSSFTEDENQTMIRWLRKTNVLPSVGGSSIWKRFLKEKVLPKRNDLSAAILSAYFNRKLKKHPTFMEWIGDMKASGRELKPAFEKAPRYSEEENRIMIQHIIAHGAYRRTTVDRVWLELLESSKSSLNPKRTARGLIQHFSCFLLKNYAKYTDDPEALRKFKELELRSKQLRTHTS